MHQFASICINFNQLICTFLDKEASVCLKTDFSMFKGNFINYCRSSAYFMKLGLEFEKCLNLTFDIECTYHAEILITLKREF
jgi:hypothetical protein